MKTSTQIILKFAERVVKQTLAHNANRSEEHTSELQSRI